MSSELSISTILSIGDLSSVLASAANQKNTLFRGATLDPMLPRTIARVKRSVSIRFSANPSDATLRGAAEYLLQLCGPFALQAQTIISNLSGALPIITGPANQSVFVNATATFSVSVVSDTPVTYQWFDSVGNPIPGATSSSYNFPNAQLSDYGKTFFVKATNSAGQTVSGTATLTVTAALVALTWFGSVDPNPDLQAGIDNLPYQITTSIVHNQPISITIPQAATPNMWFVTKVVNAESLKTVWFNTPTNQGTINPPDGNYNAQIQFGGFTFYPTHEELSFDFHSPLILS